MRTPAPRLLLATRVYRGLLVLAFVLGITLPLLDWGFAIDDTPELIENRALAPLPKWPTDLRQWKALPAGLESYWNDAFGFRRQLIRWHAISRWALGVSASPNVIIGKRSFLFFAGDQALEQHRGLRPLTTLELTKWADQLEARRKWLESLGAHYLFVIAPDKQSIYPEDVPDRYGPLQHPPIEQFLSYMKLHTGVTVLDLRGPLQEARKREVVYLRTDSHWNDAGAFAGYTSIVHALNAWYPQMVPRPRARFGFEQTPPWNGDLSLMLGGIYDVTTETAQAWLPDTPPAVRDVSDAPGFRPHFAYRYYAYQSADASRPRALVLHDSFLMAADERIVPGQVYPERAKRPPTPQFRISALLAEQFSRSVFAWQYPFESAWVEAEHPDLVIEEHVERQLVFAPEGMVPTPLTPRAPAASVVE